MQPGLCSFKEHVASEAFLTFSCSQDRPREVLMSVDQEVLGGSMLLCPGLMDIEGKALLILAVPDSPVPFLTAQW